MTREQLEHILRAAEGITGAREFVIIGSQAILGQFRDAPRELLLSMEADVFTRRSPDDAELIDGSIGEGSPFHKTFGYYAHGVGRETAILPEDWEKRLVPIRSGATAGATGLCLEVHDLVVSKLVSGREKDLEFVGDVFKHRLADPTTVRDRLTQTRLDERVRALCEGRLARLSV
jgi:hypothetical protein